MNRGNILRLVFFQQNQFSKGPIGHFKCSYLYDSDGPLGLETIKEVLNDLGMRDLDLTFESIDELKRFGTRLCEKGNYQALHFVSHQEVSVALDGIHKMDDYLKVFVDSGEYIPNQNYSYKKGFLGRFF